MHPSLPLTFFGGRYSFLASGQRNSTSPSYFESFSKLYAALGAFLGKGSKGEKPCLEEN